MKRTQSDVVLLLSLLILFSGSIGLMHKRKSPYSFSKNSATHMASENVSVDHIMQHIAIKLYSGDAYNVAAELIQFPESMVKDVLITLVQDENSPFEENKKIALVLAVARGYDKKNREEFYTVFLEQAVLIDKYPVFYIAAQEGLGDEIMPVSDWLHSHDEQMYKQWHRDALVRAVEMNDIESMKKMALKGISPDFEQATNLLAIVVAGDKDVEFVPFLVKRGADVNGSSNKILFIEQAVQNKNNSMVQILVNNGMRKKAVKKGFEFAFKIGGQKIEQWLIRAYEHMNNKKKKTGINNSAMGG